MINNGYVKEEEYILEEDKSFSKRSVWTAAESVDFKDGKNLEDKLGKISGLIDSISQYNSTNQNGYAVDCMVLKSLLQSVKDELSEQSKVKDMLPIALTLKQYNALTKDVKNNGREYNIIEDDSVIPNY